MIYSIQILRGLAAFAVVLIHSEALMYDYYGVLSMKLHEVQIFDDARSGVDLFFVISGFIMTYNYLKKGTSWSDFIVNRIIRIVPLYWLLSISLYLLFLFVPALFSNLRLEFEQLIYSLFFMPNENSPVIKIGWTLNYEMFFYLLFSLVFFLPKKADVQFVWLILALLVLSGLMIDSENIFFTHATSPLLTEFLIGSILAHMYFEKQLKTVLGYVIAAVGLILVIVPLPGGRVIDWGLGCALLFWGCLVLPLKDQVFENRFAKALIWLGDISFSLYLVHDFVLPAVGKVWFRVGLNDNFPMLTLPLLTILASVLGAWITYRLIEKPSGRYLKTLWKRVS